MIADNTDLFITVDGRPLRLTPRTYTVGTAPTCQIRIMAHGPPLEWARLQYIAGWQVRAKDRSVEIFVDGTFASTGYAALPSSGRLLLRQGPATTEMIIGNHRPQQPPQPAGQSGFEHTWTMRVGEAVTIGRAGGPAQIALPGLDLALEHAVVRWTGRSLEIRSSATNARPFIAGQPVIFARVPVGGEFMIAHHSFVVPSPGQLALESGKSRKTGNPYLRLRNLSLQYRSRPSPTLVDMSFDLGQGEVLAVIGPSGAGKSTMCGALLGEVDAIEGSIWLGQLNLAESRQQASHVVSFVPQQPTIYGDLRLRESLLSVARLRLADDITSAERANRVDQVIETMSLSGEVEKRVDTLSGGQRKRASMAMELLSDPLLLVLDEPTSGLDEGLDRQMMDNLKRIANGGCTVVVVTHSMVNIDRADNVLAVTGKGRLGFYGPPSEIQEAYDAPDYAAVMEKLRSDRRVAPPATGSFARPLVGDIRSVPAQRGSLRRHLVPLVAREFKRQRHSFRSLATNLAIAPIATALLAAAAYGQGLSGDIPDPKHRGVILALVVCLAFFAMSQSFSSIVGDREVIERESRWGVSASSVILSRAIASIPAILWLGLTSFALFALLTREPPDDPVLLPNWAGVATFCVLLPLTAMTLGMLVSTASKTLKQAVFVLMGVLAGQVVLTGLALPFTGVSGSILKVASVFMPTRWAATGIGAFVGLDGPENGLDLGTTPSTDLLWTHSEEYVAASMAALVVLGIVCLVASTLILRSQLRGRR